MSSATVSLNSSFRVNANSLIGIPGIKQFSRFIGVDKPLTGNTNLIKPFRSRLLDLTLQARLGSQDSVKAGMNINGGLNLGGITGSTQGSMKINRGSVNSDGTVANLTFDYSPIRAGLKTTAGRAFLKVDPVMSLKLNPEIYYDVDPIGKAIRWKGAKQLSLNISDNLGPIVDIDTSRGDKPTSGTIGGISYSVNSFNPPSFSLDSRSASFDPVTGRLFQTHQNGTQLFSAGFDIASLSPIPLSLKGDIAVGPFSAYANLTGVEGIIGIGLSSIAKTTSSLDFKLDVIGEDGSKHTVRSGRRGIWAGGSDTRGMSIRDVDSDGNIEGTVKGSIYGQLSAEVSVVPSLTAKLNVLAASAGLEFKGIKVAGRRIAKKSVSGNTPPLISLGSSADLGSISLVPKASSSYQREVFKSSFSIPIAEPRLEDYSSYM